MGFSIKKRKIENLFRRQIGKGRKSKMGECLWKNATLKGWDKKHPEEAFFGIGREKSNFACKQMSEATECKMRFLLLTQKHVWHREKNSSQQEATPKVRVPRGLTRQIYQILRSYGWTLQQGLFETFLFLLKC